MSEEREAEKGEAKKDEHVPVVHDVSLIQSKA